MTMTATRVLQWGAERARAGPWRGDPSVALLSPVPGASPPSADFVRRCLTTLAAQGYERVVTGALTVAEQTGFRAAGFGALEYLHLLRHDLRTLPEGPDTGLRRAGRADRPGVLAVDGLAFSPFWRLDEGALDEAIAATPHARFRVTAGAVVGYAVTGRAGRRGYVQRLAVHPDHQRRGLGRALVIDGLRWLRRWRADEALVNTQESNEPALALYEALGFTRQQPGLHVLAADLR